MSQYNLDPLSACCGQPDACQQAHLYCFNRKDKEANVDAMHAHQTKINEATHGSTPAWAVETLAAAEKAIEQEAPRSMPSNPKQVFGDAKVPLSLVSTVAIAEESLACLEGNLKYGLVNYRGNPVEAMTYIKAGERHRKLWMEGEERDPVSGVHHLAYSRACDGIIIDAQAHGTLIDNRPMSGAFNSEYMARLSVIVLHLRELYGDKNPRHYTIADNAE